MAVANGLPAPTTVHWHGIALRNDMDGVPDLTQPQIAAAGSFTYEFALAHAGTYWFHPHVGTQLDRGLYAPLIVEDPDERADYD
ncbi:multicopper oxidase family protein, partial [Mycobacteroides abscessus]